MGDAARFGIAILIFFASMLCFFIAFHPSGASPAQNPDDVLKWLIGEWDTGTATPGTKAPANTTGTSG